MVSHSLFLWFLPAFISALTTVEFIARPSPNEGTVPWHERCLVQFGAENPKEFGMATQIVMDYTGDTRHYFDAEDTKALSKAEERFRALTSVGFTAAVRTADGESNVTRSFDPTAKESLFFPRLVG